MKQMQHSKAAKCWQCGQEITSVSQRCAADCDVSCMPEREPEAKPQAKKQEKALAKTRVEKTESLGKCWQCGQEITSVSQRCAADCDVSCMPEREPEAKPQAKKQEKALAKTRVEKTESLGKCWQCGQEITSVSQRCAADCDVSCMPEREPEAKPQAKKQEKSPAKTRVEKTKSLGQCRMCGQEITSEFQRCPADCDVFCVPSQEAGK